jgi:hypothetical protein
VADAVGQYYYVQFALSLRQMLFDTMGARNPSALQGHEELPQHIPLYQGHKGASHVQLMQLIGSSECRQNWYFYLSAGYLDK